MAKLSRFIRMAAESGRKRRKKFIRSGKFLVYIVECADGTYYTGYTSNLEKRIKEHNSGKRGAVYTRYKRPVRLVYVRGYGYFKLAMQEECRIKSLRRWQKEKLMKSGENEIGIFLESRCDK